MAAPTTPGSEPEPELLGSVQALAVRVADLSDHLSVSQDQASRIERQARRSKYLSLGILAVAVVALVGVVLAGVLLGQVRDAVHSNEAAVKSNEANAVTNCQNANEARKANKVLWDFLIDASLAQDTQTAQSRDLLVELQSFIAALYEPRDCSDLSKKYPLPKPPAITNLSPKKG